ncbi:hypothetical protein TIFTF001_011546 [Ficus carica]|uniref:DYW domain-containing protein n=1 Tax=Ficus carica TaxID=3494 RepID=A0AA88D0U0_FICCA|nr:hypothetical protein TIFTF001_011546 [Ficus carica]
MIPAISLSNTTVPTNLTVTSGPNNPKTHRRTTSTHPTPPNSTLKSLAKSGKLEDALRLIESWPSKFPAASEPDAEAYSLLLHACISRRSLEHGQRLYLQLLLSRDRSKHNLLNNPTLKSKLITLYSVCGRLDEACSVFLDGLEDGKEVPESVWVAMAIGYSRNGLSEQALLLYCEMLSRCVWPGNFAFSMALKACFDIFDLRVGRAVHGQIVKSSEKPDQVVNNALLRLYAECGCPGDALKVFETMPIRNVVSWNSLIASFASRDQVFDALAAFRKMQGEGMGFSWVTLTTILSVCTRVTALHSGKEIHAQIVKSANRPDIPVLNSLLDMYAKCGEVDYCRRLFDKMQGKDLTSRNTMLTGYAVNGFIEEALALFDAMVQSGLKPDGVSFIALLSGCSHAGLIDEGRRLFNEMKSEYGVSPTIEHYACLVDILGRAGDIKEALEVVETMPKKPSCSIWGSLLNSCRLHGNVSLGKLVAYQLFELEPNNPGNYVMLSNIYANAGIWDGVESIRELMEEKGIKKEAGCSWIQIRNRIHTFVAGGSFEFRNSAEFEKVWSELTEALEENGYTPNTSVVLHDVNDEMKASWVCGHSERLATTFALINTSDGVPIRITKNLRVCVDCHSWMKLVSKITERVIILRDTNRFHHFKGGACSCKDYW